MPRVVLITGGPGGIGRATGERFAAGGDLVVSADRSADALAGVAGDTIVADVTRAADCERMVAETVARHGRLDVLVNCARVWVAGPTAEALRPGARLRRRRPVGLPRGAARQLPAEGAVALHPAGGDGGPGRLPRVSRRRADHGRLHPDRLREHGRLLSRAVDDAVVEDV